MGAGRYDLRGESGLGDRGGAFCGESGGVEGVRQGERTAAAQEGRKPPGGGAPDVACQGRGRGHCDEDGAARWAQDAAHVSQGVGQAGSGKQVVNVRRKEAVHALRGPGEGGGSAVADLVAPVGGARRPLPGTGPHRRRRLQGLRPARRVLLEKGVEGAGGAGSHFYDPFPVAHGQPLPPPAAGTRGEWAGEAVIHWGHGLVEGTETSRRAKGHGDNRKARGGNLRSADGFGQPMRVRGRGMRRPACRPLGGGAGPVGRGRISCIHGR